MAKRLSDLVDPTLSRGPAAGKGLTLDSQGRIPYELLGTRGPSVLEVGEYMSWNGTDWVNGSLHKEAATFPASPSNGDIQIIAGAVDGQSWMFVYNGNTADEMKWEFIGGAPGHTRVEADAAITSGSYVATDCTVTMPAGITWDVHCIFGCRSYTTGSSGAGAQAYFSLSHDGDAANDAWAAQSQQTNVTYGDPIMTCTSAVQFNSVAASDAIVFEGRTIDAGSPTSHFTRRYLTVWPIRAKNV